MKAMETGREERIELTQEQLRTLGAPVRDELLRAFVGGGPASVAEVAHQLNRPPKSLYYQVRKMEAAGLLRQVGTRGSGPRKEVLYDAVAHRFSLGDAKDEASRAHVNRAVKAALRTAMREFEGANHESQEGVQIILRGTARLSAEHARRLSEMLREAAEYAKAHDQADAPVRYTLTTLLTPVARP